MTAPSRKPHPASSSGHASKDPKLAKRLKTLDEAIKLLHLRLRTDISTKDLCQCAYALAALLNSAQGYTRLHDPAGSSKLAVFNKAFDRLSMEEDPDDQATLE